MSFLRQEEIDRLFSVIGSIRDRAIFRLAYHAGLRASEIGLLELRDYNRPHLMRRLKGSNSGHYHLRREETGALRAWLKVRRSFPIPIFLSKQRRPIDRTTLHLSDEEVRSRSRHSVAPPAFPGAQDLHCCALIEQGVLERVRDWIGNANVPIDHGILQVTKARRDDMAQQLRERGADIR